MTCKNTLSKLGITLNRGSLLSTLRLTSDTTVGDQVYRVWLKSITLRLSGNISPTTESFKIKFYTPLVCSYLCIITNFIQLSLTLTKLCHIKCNHLVNFYILFEKREKSQYLCNSTTDVHNLA